MKYEPHGYQQHAITKIVEEPSLGLLMDPGLGKTSCTLAGFDLLKGAGIVDKMLVICPLRPMYETWPAEIKKWDDFNGLSYCFLHGKNKEEAFKADADIYLINPEGLKWLNEKKDWPFDMLVVDESTKFKNNRSKRFQMLKFRLDAFERRYILTGTPAPNGLIDLWSQIYILDGGEALGRYVTHYRRNYFYPLISNGKIVYKWGIAAGSEDVIYQKIDPITIRLDQEDYLKLPELVFQDIYIDLPPKARKAYNAMEKHFIAELKETKVVTAANAAVMTNKIRQIANGGIYTTKKEWEDIHFEKAKATADMVDELNGQRVLISYDLKHDRERLMKELADFNPRYIGGGVSAKAARNHLADWNSGNYPVLLGHPSSVSHGLNLQAGNHIILHSLTWNLEDYDQFIKRLWRQGQEKPVFVYRIIARDTIDEVIIDALAGKARTQKSLLDKLRKKYL
jgi:SNF2 family DNA or RNA helicase